MGAGEGGEKQGFVFGEGGDDGVLNTIKRVVGVGVEGVCAHGHHYRHVYGPQAVLKDRGCHGQVDANGVGQAGGCFWHPQPNGGGHGLDGVHALPTAKQQRGRNR